MNSPDGHPSDERAFLRARYRTACPGPWVPKTLPHSVRVRLTTVLVLDAFSRAMASLPEVSGSEQHVHGACFEIHSEGDGFNCSTELDSMFVRRTEVGLQVSIVCVAPSFVGKPGKKSPLETLVRARDGAVTAEFRPLLRRIYASYFIAKRSLELLQSAQHLEVQILAVVAVDDKGGFDSLEPLSSYECDFRVSPLPTPHVTGHVTFLASNDLRPAHRTFDLTDHVLGLADEEQLFDKVESIRASAPIPLPTYPNEFLNTRCKDCEFQEPAHRPESTTEPSGFQRCWGGVSLENSTHILHKPNLRSKELTLEIKKATPGVPRWHPHEDLPASDAIPFFLSGGDQCIVKFETVYRTLPIAPNVPGGTQWPFMFEAVFIPQGHFVVADHTRGACILVGDAPGLEVVSALMEQLPTSGTIWVWSDSQMKSLKVLSKYFSEHHPDRKGERSFLESLVGRPGDDHHSGRVRDLQKVLASAIPLPSGRRSLLGYMVRHSMDEKYQSLLNSIRSHSFRDLKSDLLAVDPYVLLSERGRQLVYKLYGAGARVDYTNPSAFLYMVPRLFGQHWTVEIQEFLCRKARLDTAAMALLLGRASQGSSSELVVDS